VIVVAYVFRRGSEGNRDGPRRRAKK